MSARWHVTCHKPNEAWVRFCEGRTIFYRLEPEVAGGLGEATVMDTSVYPPRVQYLHYQFDGWLGDELVESFPCWVVTERLRTAIEQSEFTGATFAPVLITTSDTFRALYPETELPV